MEEHAHDDDRFEDQTHAARADRPEPLPIGSFAPEWEVGDWSDDRPRALADYHGHVVFLEFWGIWCGPCLHALPVVEKLRAKYERLGVVFLSIHTPRESEVCVREVLEQKKVSLVFAIDCDRKADDNNVSGVTAERYGVVGYPTMLIADREGRIAFRSTDPVQGTAFRAMIKEMGYDERLANAEEASRVIERCLDRAIEAALNPRPR
jgi:thiol-disulfide isomerase/thioredoxin